MSNSGLEAFSSILLGTALGLMLAGGLDSCSAVNSLTYQAKSAIKKCEATLPRNERCIVTAVPEKETNDE